MKTVLVQLLVLVLLISCSHQPKDVRLILKAAGDNRSELESVIDHYKASGDKEKLKAAYFLIGNMNDKYSLEGENVRKYDPIFEVYDSFAKTHTPPPYLSPALYSRWDSLVKVFGPPAIRDSDVIFDCTHIKAAYLIENIDLSFKLRDMSSWGRKISFDQFCEYVLAYRLRHEPLEPWRYVLYEKYKALRDSVNADSVIQLARVIHKQLFRFLRYHVILSDYPFDIPLDRMKIERYGGCPNTAVYTAMALRSVGLPAAIDFTRTWGNHHGGHWWNSLLLEDGNIIWLQGDVSAIGWVFDMKESKIAKIYRKTFARQNTELPANNQDVPISLSDNYLLDVTNEYTKAYNIRIPLKIHFTSKKKYAVICTYDNSNWVSQDWGKIEKNQAYFKNMGSGIVYLGMYYDNGSLYPASNPFILSEEGKVSFLVPTESETQNMLLTRKYPLYKQIRTYMSTMVNGTFQGANNPDFRDSVILFTIPKFPEKFETATITNPLKFRYVRYRSNYPGRYDIAELEFYGREGSSDTLKLKGKVIGFPKSLLASYQDAFDANLETFFGRSTKESIWTGLDLGAPKRITKIRYCPRSDTNFILEGDTYELCYCGNGEWISMGGQVATDQFLNYKNVPSGALYILHNLTRGMEERIFTYEDGKQIFW